MYLKSRNKHKRIEVLTQARQNRPKMKISDSHHDCATESDKFDEEFKNEDESWLADVKPQDYLNRKYLRPTPSIFYQQLTKPTRTRKLGLRTQHQVSNSPS